MILRIHCALYRSEEGYTRKKEDIAFFGDQRGVRKMVMDEKDVTGEEESEQQVCLDC